MTISGWGKFNRRNGEFSTGVDRRQFRRLSVVCQIRTSGASTGCQIRKLGRGDQTWPHMLLLNAWT